MNITLAGFNIDTTVSAQLQPRDQVTPEILSAAYARISRSKKNVTELRAEARDEVAQARKSNETIIFEMGHSSVAEHAVFNFDIVGISRYLVETIQRSRLASFTEKSQRYVTLQGDFVMPQEIAGTPLEAEFNQLIQR
jgi:thymidylate synthase ThyX